MSTAPPPVAAPVPPAAQPAQPGLSPVARIIDTFVAPSKTFLDIRQNASWWLPLVLSSIFAIAFWIMVDKKVGFEQVAQKTLSSSPRFEQASPELQSQQVRVTAAILKYTGYVSPIFILLFALVIALVLWGTFNFGFAAELDFSRSLAIVMYGWLPGVVSSILAMVSLGLGDPEGFRLDSPVGTNPAYYMDPHTTSKFLLAALSSFDVISLWIVVLIGIGFAVNAKKKLDTGTAIGVVAAWYFFVKLIGAVFALLRG